MTTQLDDAQAAILAPADLTEKMCQQVLQSMLAHDIDYADLYFQHMRFESWSLEDGIVKDASHSIERGVGVRAISQERTGFAFSDEVVLPSLTDAAKAARSIARAGQEAIVPVASKTTGRTLYTGTDPLQSLSADKKVDLLRSLDQHARAIDSRVQQVQVSLSGTFEIILMLNSIGEWAADIRPLVRLNISVIAIDGKRHEQGYAGCGGRSDYQLFEEKKNTAQLAEEAVRQALVNLEAVDAPAGTMPVVLGPGWPGVLLHEAVGHGLEGDFNRKGTSAFSNRLGERVAAKGVTVVDDGTLEKRRGSLNIDDEGIQTNCTTLIEDGILKGYMQDRLNAKLMKMAPTGNGRRESYACLPMPRMTNTYMLAGTQAPEEIIASVDKGLYAVNFSGGQVDITSGKFVFAASEAYLIEKGKITHPVKGATIIGNGPDVMTKVSMIGNDLQLDTGIGICGKDGQSVPVGVGQPTLRVDAMTVGGTSE